MMRYRDIFIASFVAYRQNYQLLIIFFPLSDEVEMFDRLAAKSQSSVEKVTVKNVMNPLLWICGLVTIPSLGILFWSENVKSWAFEFLAVVPPTAAIIFYGYFAFRSPDRLQSEGYQLKKQVIELIEEKGSIGPIDARGLQVISNPDLIRLDAHPMPETENNAFNKEPG